MPGSGPTRSRADPPAASVSSTTGVPPTVIAASSRHGPPPQVTTGATGPAAGSAAPEGATGRGRSTNTAPIAPTVTTTASTAVSSADRGVRAAEVRIRQSVSRFATVCGQRPVSVWPVQPDGVTSSGACPSMLSG